MKSFYKLALITIIVFFCVFPTQASSQKATWHSGQVTLWDKTVLQGNVSYNWLAEMIMIHQSDGRVATFSANQVFQFGWFDYNLHKQRDFKSLPGFMPKDRNNRAFFEICMDGPLTVVRRLRHPRGFLRRAFGHPTHYTDQPAMAQNTEHFDYFVYDANRLVALDRFYQEIYTPLMTAYDRELQTYILRHNINSRTLLGRLVIVDHYNFLVQKDARTASTKSYGSIPN